MEEDKTNTAKSNSEKADNTNNKNNQRAKNTNQSGQTNQNANSNSPDWLMHLLTGAGALGGNYILFIKPLQEKFDAMNQAILHHEKVIKDLQEQIDLLNHKTKKAKQREDDTDEQNEEELFTTKKKDKTNPSSMNGTRRTVRF